MYIAGTEAAAKHYKCKIKRGGCYVKEADVCLYKSSYPET